LKGEKKSNPYCGTVYPIFGKKSYDIPKKLKAEKQGKKKIYKGGLHRFASCWSIGLKNRGYPDKRFCRGPKKETKALRLVLKPPQSSYHGDAAVK